MRQPIKHMVQHVVPSSMYSPDNSFEIYIYIYIYIYYIYIYIYIYVFISITEPPCEASTLHSLSSCRWTLSLMCCICYILTNMMRSHINIAIICMVKTPNTSQYIQSNVSSYQGSETCNRQHSESDEIKV